MTCLVTVGQRIVESGFLDAFHARHPGMIVELLMEQRMFDLSKGEADIAIRGGTLGSVEIYRNHRAIAATVMTAR